MWGGTGARLDGWMKQADGVLERGVDFHAALRM
jgi:hypothetical protein